jgi:hypothetical protein
MDKKWIFVLCICSLCLWGTACGPSEEKLEEAKQTYSQLAAIHNQVVEAHKNIEDDSMDETLTQIREEMAEVENCNLADMKDEEIDSLIAEMNELIGSYESALETISGIKEEEDAAVLVPIPVTVINNSTLTFTVLKLYEKGDYDTHVNILEGMNPLEKGKTLAGLVIQRDVDNTPWILALQDAEGGEYETELPTEEYTTKGVSLKITFDGENVSIE